MFKAEKYPEMLRESILRAPEKMLELPEILKVKAISMMRLTTQFTQFVENGVNKKSSISARRVVFKWLPVLCSSDVVHGSWWFVWGSFLSMLIPLCVIINPYVHIYPTHLDTYNTLPALGDLATWVLLLISGFFVTLGSLAFLRAFSDPPLPPLFSWKHVATDELLAAWLLLIGTLPGVPYAAIWLIYYPSNVLNLAFLVASCLFSFTSYLFVLSCYPNEKAHKQVVKPITRKIFGRDHWIIKHLQNDWLAGMWFNLIITIVLTIGNLGLLFKCLLKHNPEEIFIYGLGLVDFLLFLIGSFYFVAGSYPEDSERCYRVKDDDRNGLDVNMIPLAKTVPAMSEDSRTTRNVLNDGTLNVQSIHNAANSGGIIEDLEGQCNLPK